MFLEERSGLKFQPKLISTNPLKILVGRQENNEPFIPASVVVSNSILLDLKRNENGKLSGVWWKHTHACHQYTSQF